MKKIFEFIDSFCTAVMFITVVILFFCRVIVVDGDSMLPTLQSGEKIITTNFFYQPEVGDIVVTDSNNGYKKPLIKRVIATGGDTIKSTIQQEMFISTAICWMRIIFLKKSIRPTQRIWK